MKTRIHINQHNIKSNKTKGTKLPVVTVKDYKSNIKCDGVIMEGPCRVIYSPDKPLDCGAHVWIETEGEVIPIHNMDYSH